MEWKDPPDAAHYGRTGGRWLAAANELRLHPDQWALICTQASSSMPSDIKAGRTKGFEPAGAFEAVARRHPNSKDKYDIYARYVGNGHHTP